MKNFVIVDIKRQVSLSTFRATDMEIARRLAADTDFGWNPYGDDRTIDEVFEKYGVEVHEVDDHWMEEMTTPKHIVGIDEVGLGAWAGPLVVCAFAAPDEDWKMPSLDDSKKLAKGVRERVAKELMRKFPDNYTLIQVDSWDIDKHGIKKVLPMAMERALERLIDKTGVPNRVIVDGDDKGLKGAEYYHRADGQYPAVMAASVIAKVFRDDRMALYSEEYPKYGFENHVGYGVPKHEAAIRAHGMCPLHRRSFQPMKGLVYTGAGAPPLKA
jgi:ribonuclease HII